MSSPFNWAVIQVLFVMCWEVSYPNKAHWERSHYKTNSPAQSVFAFHDLLYYISFYVFK